LKDRDHEPRIQTFVDFVFLPAGLDFVANGFEFVAVGFAFAADGLVFVPWPKRTIESADRNRAGGE
jgi:hypothetical protein